MLGSRRRYRASTVHQASPMLRLPLALLVVASTQSVVATPGEGQLWEPTCPGDCGFRSTLRLTLGDDGDGIVGPEAVVARIGDRYYVSDHTMLSSIQVFSVARGYEGSIGRQGQGPGEYVLIQDLDVDQVGRLWVVDALQGRATILEVTGAEGSVAATVPLVAYRPARRGLTLLGDDRFLLNAGVSTADRIGSWTHLVDVSEGVQWSLDDDPERAKAVGAEQRFYALDGDGNFWSVWGDGRYRIERRRIADGSLVGAFEPRRAWYEDHQESVPIAPKADGHTGAFTSPASIKDVQLRGKELWVLGAYGDEDGYRNVIDVFDIESQHLLRSKALDMQAGSYYSGFLAPNLVVKFEMTDVGTRLHLMEVEFAR